MSAVFGSVGEQHTILYLGKDVIGGGIECDTIMSVWIIVLLASIRTVMSCVFFGHGVYGVSTLGFFGFLFCKRDWAKALAFPGVEKAMEEINKLDFAARERTQQDLLDRSSGASLLATERRLETLRAALKVKLPFNKWSGSHNRESPPKSSERAESKKPAKRYESAKTWKPATFKIFSAITDW